MRCLTEIPDGPNLIVRHAAGTADALLAAAIDEHASHCAECARLLAEQRAVSEALDDWTAPAVSADFDRRLYSRIDQEVPWWNFLVEPFRPRFVSRLAPVAAATALLVVAGLWIARPVASIPAPDSAQIEALPAEQAEHVLEQMQVAQELSNLAPADSADPIL